jgi:hypothetical protein
VWERGRGEGRTVQNAALRFTLLPSPPPVLCSERAFPHPSPTREREIRRVSALPGSFFETPLTRLLKMRSEGRASLLRMKLWAMSPYEPASEQPIRRPRRLARGVRRPILVLDKADF